MKGWLLFLLFCPVFFAGMLWEYLVQYFNAGRKATKLFG